MTSLDDDDVAAVISEVGPRPVPAADRGMRVRAAAQRAWHTEVRRRRQRRWIWSGAALATAATVLLLVQTSINVPVAPPAASAPAIGAMTAVGAAVQVINATMTRSIAAGDSQDVATGARIETGATSTAVVRLQGGEELRLASGTRAVLEEGRTVRLDQGLLYVDSHGATPGGFTVITGGGIVRDIGTQFEVRITGSGATRVRVRSGAVQLERGGTIDRASAGTELSVVDGRVETRAIAPHDADWRWTTAAAPAFRVEGATLDAFLAWVIRESGYEIDATAVPERLRRTVLHGSVAGMTVDDALANVLPTCGLVAQVARGRVTIRIAR